MHDFPPRTTPSLDELVGVLRGRRVVALTGAGISTESGIPDYRGPTTRHLPRRPIQHREFVERADVRRRYWARSMVGFARLAGARPNPAHHALATLEARGVLAGIITQNVDGLHHAAGSRAVVELHGAIRDVRCLACGALDARARVQERLERENGWLLAAEVPMAPDGDADLDPAWIDRFVPATCRACDGELMPAVVFFGGNVPRPVVDEAFALLEAADALLVVGTSLAVYSGYRFAKRAAEHAMPIAIVNLGETRADALARVKVEASAGEVLPALAAASA